MTISQRVALLAISITLVAGCETMATIDRGIYAGVEQVTERDRVTGRRTVSIADRQQQIIQGNAAAEQIIRQAQASGKRINADYDEGAYKRIVRIFDRLHEVSHLSHEVWTPILIEDNNWNAFTTGGTYFVINSALEEDLTDDSELANVIAHEMAHTIANHAFEQNAYTLLNSVGGSASANRESFQAAFTHESEEEADLIGILYCALAGFDPYAGARIWQRMHARYGNNAGFISTHPMRDERARNAITVASRVEGYYLGQNVMNPNHKAILENNTLFAKTPDSGLKGGEGGGIFALLEATLETYNQKQQAKLEEQRQEGRVSFIRAVEGATTLNDSRPIGYDTWRFTLSYYGSVSVTDVSFKATISSGTQQTSQTRHMNGVLYPNTTYYVDVQFPGHDVRYTHPASVSLSLDNAKPYP